MSDMLLEMQPRKFTVAEFHRMAEEGILRDDERVELLDGLLIPMSPIGPPHRALHWQIDDYLKRVLSGQALVSGKWSQPLGEFNEPQPDIIILALKPEEFFKRDAFVEEVYAMVEVADTSLVTETGFKRDLYARFGVPDYLVADVGNRRLLHYALPIDDRYGEPQHLSYGDTFTLQARPDIILNADPFLLPRV